VLTKMTSARFPGVIDPICESMPMDRAPSMVDGCRSLRGRDRQFVLVARPQCSGTSSSP
jgi:hypothetical protein